MKQLKNKYQPRVAQKLILDAEYLVFRVTDTGTGMTKEQPEESAVETAPTQTMSAGRRLKNNKINWFPG